MVSVSNLAAVTATLNELERMRRIETVDAALVAAVKCMAETLDESPGNAQLWKQYLDALARLIEADDDVDDALTAALADLRSSTPVGDATET